MDILYGLAVSMHLGFEGEYNMIHPHVRLQNNQFVSGAFYNSESNLSYYTGIQIENTQWTHEFGLVVGYSDSKLAPYFRSTIDVNENIIGYITPGIENGNIGIVLGLEFWNKR